MRHAARQYVGNFPRQQFFDTIDRMVGDAFEHVAIASAILQRLAAFKQHDRPVWVAMQSFAAEGFNHFLTSIGFNVCLQ